MAIGVLELLILGLLCLGVFVAAVVGLLVLIFQSRPTAWTRSSPMPAPPRHCPQCGTLLAADAPEGLCPQCLLKHGLQSEIQKLSQTPRNVETQAAADSPRLVSEPKEPSTGAFGEPPGSSRRSDLPSPAELARHFPQLEILELLGQGGMGAVYKARQPKLDRLVALKILPPEAGQEPHFAERFQREAKALAQLDHPHIVRVHDFGQTGAQGEPGALAPGRTIHYFVMEYVDGVNLRQLMRSGQLTPEQALPIVGQICEALQFAHEEGVVHRDIKPENILLDKKGRVKIADFGLAKLLGQATDYALTRTHQVMGTPHYMAPEQITTPQMVDHRADIYSLGVVFYEMLTGDLPMGRFDPPSRKVQIDVRLDEVVLKALDKEPDRRYQRVSEIKTEVESIASGGRATTAALAPRSLRQSEQSPSERAEELIRGPAIGLLATAILSFTANLCFFVVALYLPHPIGSDSLVCAFWWTILSLPLDIVIFRSARKMARLEAHGQAVTSSILAMLPLSPIFPVGILVGIWALYLLSKPEVKAAFAGREASCPPLPPVPVERQVGGPAIGLLVTVVFELISFLAAVIALVALQYRILGMDLSLVVLSVFLLCVISLPIQAVQFVGAYKMRRLEGYGWAVCAAILALLPVSPAWIVGLPIGIWALVVLSRPAVKEEFAARRKHSAARQTGAAPANEVAEPATPALAVFWPATALIVLGLLDVLGLIYTTWAFFSFHRASARELALVMALGVCSLLALFAVPVIIVGGVHMRQLRSQPLARFAAIMALVPVSPTAVLGIPIGIWALIVLSRPEVKASFSTHSSAALDLLGRLLRQPATWGVVLGVLGALTAFLPWIEVSVFGTVTGTPGPEEWHVGTENALGVSFHALTVCGFFLAVGLFELAAGFLPRQGWWHPLILGTASVVVLVLVILFLLSLNNPVTSSDPLVTAALQDKIRVRSHAGPYVALVLSIGLLGLAMLDARRLLRERHAAAAPADADLSSS